MTLPLAGGNNTIQVAITEAGFIGPTRLEALRRLGDVEIVALCDNRPEATQRKTQALNIAHTYNSVEALLTHPGLRVVHSCTPNHLHTWINRRILAAGLHVFSKKPLCMTAKEARKLAALTARAGVVHGINFVYRQFAIVQQTAATIRRGKIGRILAAHNSYLQDWMLLETDHNRRIDSARGGASRTVADVDSHWCDTVQSMTGRWIVEAVTNLPIVWPTRKAPVNDEATFGAVHEAQAYEARPVDTGDFGPMLLRFDDGSKDNLMASRVSARREDRLVVGIDGSFYSLAWGQGVPQRLWIGYREQPDRLPSDDPGPLRSEATASTHYPGGHIKG